MPSPNHALVFAGFAPYFVSISNGYSRTPETSKAARSINRRTPSIAVDGGVSSLCPDFKRFLVCQQGNRVKQDGDKRLNCLIGGFQWICLKSILRNVRTQLWRPRLTLVLGRMRVDAGSSGINASLALADLPEIDGAW